MATFNPIRVRVVASAPAGSPSPIGMGPSPWYDIGAGKYETYVEIPVTVTNIGVKITESARKFVGWFNSRFGTSLAFESASATPVEKKKAVSKEAEEMDALTRLMASAWSFGPEEAGAAAGGAAAGGMPLEGGYRRRHRSHRNRSHRSKSQRRSKTHRR